MLQLHDATNTRLWQAAIAHGNATKQSGSRQHMQQPAQPICNRVISGLGRQLMCRAQAAAPCHTNTAQCNVVDQQPTHLGRGSARGYTRTRPAGGCEP